MGVNYNACRIEYNCNAGGKGYSLFDEDLCTLADRNRHSCSHPLTNRHVKNLRNPKIRIRVCPNRPRDNPTSSANQTWRVCTIPKILINEKRCLVTQLLYRANSCLIIRVRVPPIYVLWSDK